MKIDTLKIFLISLTLAMVIPSVQAQFDDVYYDADQIDYGSYNGYSDSYSTGENDGITYYDNDEYGYFDDYDYYYTSRIRRFYRPYVGFGFYDPCYVSYNYYDPYAYNYYGYPSASIYLGFGFGFGFGYSWNSWNNCGPYGGYYGGYNNGYWGGYGNCYNNYYACTPVACYVPPVYYPPGVPGVPGGGYNDVYYGPRVSGNTGASPRVPITTGGTRPPGFTTPESDVAQPNIVSGGESPNTLPGIVNRPGTTKHSIPGVTTQGNEPIPMDDAVASTNGQAPIDRELPKDKPTSPKRPVFIPDAKYQPYPTPERTATNNVTDRSSTDKPSYKPYTPNTRSSGSTTKDNFNPSPQTDKRERTNTTSPQTAPNTRSRTDRPSYTPPPRSNQSRENTRPSSSNSRPDYTPSSGRSSSKPSYSPPSRSNSKPSYSPPSRSSQPSSGNSGGRSSGSGGSKSSTSPRGRG